MASGGSAAAKLAQGTTTGTNFWWDVDAGVPGPLLVDAVADIQALGTPINGIVWAQGEQDAKSISGESEVQIDVQRYIDATEAIFDYFRTELGDADLDIYIQQLGATTRSFQYGYDEVREAQTQIADADPDVHIAAVTYDIDLADGLHLTAGGYQTAASRLAQYVADDLVLPRSAAARKSHPPLWPAATRN